MGEREGTLLPLLLAGALAASGTLAACAERDEPAEARPEASVDDATRALAADPRLKLLLAPCAESGPYVADTADTTAILVEALERGRTDPLKAAKNELAACGEPCLREVRRSLERHWNDPDGTNFVRNAVDVAYQAEGPTARELVVRALSHRNEGVRNLALRALALHGEAEDYDRVLALLDVGGEAARTTGVPLLHALDPDRAEALYLQWIEDGTFEEGWELFAPLLAASDRPETVAFARDQRADLPLALRPFLAAAAARAGDELALADLRDLLRSPDSEIARGLAITAARAAELWDELEWSLLSDPSGRYRVLAAEAVARAPETEARNGLLRAASNDPDPGVRAVCLTARLERGDEGARDLALAALDGDTAAALDGSLRVLRAGWDDDPELADRAAALLVERAEALAHRPLSERGPLLHALGLVPRREAARFLVELARVETGELQNLPVHRWLLLRAGNAGGEGQEYLLEQLDVETDPVRRLDLIEAGSARGGEAARTRLLALLEDPETNPFEAVYAAERLARIGPTEQVLPALKRAALRMQDYTARTALNCLLWNWYPAPRAGAR